MFRHLCWEGLGHDDGAAARGTDRQLRLGMFGRGECGRLMGGLAWRKWNGGGGTQMGQAILAEQEGGKVAAQAA